MKLTIYTGHPEPLRAVGKHQCNLLSFLHKYRGMWHSMANNRSTNRALTGLQKRNPGRLQVIADQVRLTP